MQRSYDKATMRGRVEDNPGELVWTMTKTPARGGTGVTSTSTLQKSRCRYECSRLHRTVLAGQVGEFTPKDANGRSVPLALVFEN
jgi:hypothetical protein